MRQRAVVVWLSAVLSVASAQTTPAVCAAEQQAVSDVANQFATGNEKQRLSDESAQLDADSKKSSGFGVEFKVTWKDQSVVLGVPETTMVNQRTVLSVPQMTMKTRGFSLDVPVTKMGTQVVGYKPEFKCRGFKCSAKMTPILLDIPEVSMERRDFKIDIPEFTYATTTLVFGVPQFKLKQTRLVFGVPQFTVVKANAQVAKDLKDRGDALAAETVQYQQTYFKTLSPKVEVLYDCQKGGLMEQRDYLEKTYDLQVQMSQLTITHVSSQGLNPSAIPAEGGGTSDLTAALNALYASREQALAEIDAQLKALDDQKKQTLAQLQAGQ